MTIIWMLALIGVPAAVMAQAPLPVKAESAHKPPLSRVRLGSVREAGPDNLLSQSEVLNAGDLATLVPKSALLHLPANLRGVLGISSGSRIVEWREFHRSNRSWIEMFEVTPDQAEGRDLLPAKDLERFKDSRRLIVATLHGRPISIQAAGEAKSKITVTNTPPKP